MNFHNRRHVIAAFAAFALGLSAVGALAQAPSADKPERVVLPLSAGSTADAVARAMSTPLSKALGRRQPA